MVRKTVFERQIFFLTQSSVSVSIWIDSKALLYYATFWPSYRMKSSTWVKWPSIEARSNFIGSSRFHCFLPTTNSTQTSCSNASDIMGIFAIRQWVSYKPVNSPRPTGRVPIIFRKNLFSLGMQNSHSKYKFSLFISFSGSEINFLTWLPCGNLTKNFWSPGIDF